MKVGRNEKCHCGSGLKYKRCHMEADATAAIEVLNTSAADSALKAEADEIVEVETDVVERAKKGKATLLGGFWVPALVLVVLMLSVIAASNRGAPTGKVWSAKSGDWVDAPSEEGVAAKAALDPADLAAPPGGFSWELEEGVLDPVRSKFSQEAGEGAVWSDEHGHYHYPDASPTRRIPRPAGPAPEGKIWSPEHGHWHDQ